MTIQNLPVEALPFLYISGLNLSVASTTVMALAPGQARDSNDNIDIPVDEPLFLNSAVVGYNGLDQGTLAASTNYVVYLIADSSNKKPVGGIISLASNAYPLLPFGYDSYRMIGFVSTNGATEFDAATVLNTSSSMAFYLQPATSVLSGGNATTFTNIDMTPPIPDDPFTIAILDVVFTPAAVGDNVQFRPDGSAATAGLVTIVGRVAGIPQIDRVQVIVGITGTDAIVEYKVSSASDSVNVSVAGYITTLS